MLSFGVLVSLAALAHASTFTVTVGIDETDGSQGLGFDPSSIFPQAGDTITFTYQIPSYIKHPNTTQHSATQSTFYNPCTPKDGGFTTGLQSTGSENTNTGNTYNLLVNDTQPLWFFSSANSDCKSGMVLSVNPATSDEQTAAAFKQNAEKSTGIAATTSSAPGTSGSASSGSASSTSGSTPASASTTPSETNGASGLVLALPCVAALSLAVVSVISLQI